MMANYQIVEFIEMGAARYSVEQAKCVYLEVR